MNENNIKKYAVTCYAEDEPGIQMTVAVYDDLLTADMVSAQLQHSHRMFYDLYETRTHMGETHEPWKIEEMARSMAGKISGIERFPSLPLDKKLLFAWEETVWVKW